MAGRTRDAQRPLNARQRMAPPVGDQRDTAAQVRQLLDQAASLLEQAERLSAGKGTAHGRRPMQRMQHPQGPTDDRGPGPMDEDTDRTPGASRRPVGGPMGRGGHFDGPPPPDAPQPRDDRDPGPGAMDRQDDSEPSMGCRRSMAMQRMEGPMRHGHAARPVDCLPEEDMRGPMGMRPPMAPGRADHGRDGMMRRTRGTPMNVRPTDRFAPAPDFDDMD